MRLRFHALGIPFALDALDGVFLLGLIMLAVGALTGSTLALISGAALISLIFTVVLVRMLLRRRARVRSNGGDR